MRRHDPGCPFCPGNEDRTPPEILRAPGPDGGWDQRVFPNMYPALERGMEPEAGRDRRELPGIGAHEVVVETPFHDERIDEMPVERVAGFLRVWRDRYRALEREPWARSVIVFKNFGDGAGISLPHPHGQILAMPVASPDWLHRREVAVRYQRQTGRCVYEDLRDGELRARERIVGEREGVMALVPFAAGHAFETWIMPREHRSSFGDLSDEDLPGLGELLREVLGALRSAGGDPDFNLLVRSAPREDAHGGFFLWHLQIVPRTSTAAGFEIASRMSINTVAPEDAAADLRRALAQAGAP